MIEASVLIGLHICQLFRDPQSDLAPIDDKKATRNAFRHVATAFLGNVKAVTVNFGTLVEDLITSYKKLAAPCHSRCISSIDT
jgi:hypothetical protein